MCALLHRDVSRWTAGVHTCQVREKNAIRAPSGTTSGMQIATEEKRRIHARRGRGVADKNDPHAFVDCSITRLAGPRPRSSHEFFEH
jgi:hypothetical protein